jgi:hypothetical protein
MDLIEQNLKQTIKRKKTIKPKKTTELGEEKKRILPTLSAVS